MKINEITIAEDTEIDPGIRRALSKKGYKFLGKGADQAAYLEPSTGQVLKIFGTEEGLKPGSLSPEQKMAVHWIDYCKKHKNNPFLPRFSGWETFEFNDHNYLMIRMERLGKLPSNWPLALDRLSRKVYNEFGTPPIGGHAARQKHAGQAGTAELKAEDELIVYLGQEMYDLLWDTCEDIAREGIKQGYRYDLHGFNFMMRSDGTLVIADPWNMWSARERAALGM